ncbi:MAG TPA: hypothetical protein PLQ13_04970 [Candidatus Krumholzibacteria bacterium]|nr:hypothetical protein [Candidatus Krumholzibacteria bacterium]
MAETTRPAKPSFYEVVFRGKPKVVRAFMHGLTMGAGGTRTLFFSFTDGIAHEGKVERLAEKVGLLDAGCHVVMDADTAALVKSLAKRISREMGIEISSQKRIKAARLAFTYRAYNPKHDDAILRYLKALPEGVKLQGFKHDVKSDPSSKGVEAYAVAHDFEASGAGEITGPVDALVAVRQAAADYPLITLQDIELTLA